MEGNNRHARPGEAFLDNLVAELTSAAYPIVLRHGTEDSWVDLELDLWRVLAATVRKWARGSPGDGVPGEMAGWRELMLADLTNQAYFTALRWGMKGPFLEVELDLYLAFRLVMKAEQGRMFSCFSCSGP
jgi:hypothetical protein